MSEQTGELKDLVDAATNMNFPLKLRIEAIESVGNIGNHESLLALLDMVGNEQLTKKERELAVKLASNLVKAGY